MTDRKLIYKFLKYFEIRIESHTFAVIDTINGKKFTSSEFSQLFLDVFGTYKVNKDLLSIDIFDEWLKKQKKKYTKVLDAYLDKCEVKLGQFNWEIKHDSGMILNEKIFGDIFANKFDSNFLRRHFNKWYADKVLDISEKIMNTW